jgi:hypothetical protein
MDEHEFGPLLVTLSDGTKIYRNGILNGNIFVEATVGIFIFSSEFNPNTGVWESDNVASFSTSVGPGSITINPTNEGLEVSVSVSTYIFDFGLVIAPGGEVVPIVGVSGGIPNVFTFGVGFELPQPGTALSQYDTITVMKNGTILKTVHSPGNADYPYVKVDYWMYKPTGELITRGTTNIGDSEIASEMSAGTYRMPTQCFLAGTPVSLQLDTTKPIEDITIGDTVLSYDKAGNLVLRLSKTTQVRLFSLDCGSRGRASHQSRMTSASAGNAVPSPPWYSFQAGR